MHLNKAITYYVNHITKSGYSSSTVYEYQKDLKQFLSYMDAGNIHVVSLESISEAHLNAYLEYLVLEKGVAVSTRNRQMNTLRSLWKFLHSEGLTNTNKAQFLIRKEELKSDRVYLSEDEIRDLIHAIHVPLIQVVVSVLYLSGIRISECLRIKENDIDFDKDLLCIKKGKGGKPRAIPINQDLKALLALFIMKDEVHGNTLLFRTNRSGGLTASYVNRCLQKASKKLKWDKTITCHVLRHSFASNLVKQNVHVVAIQKLLGHSSLQATSSYTHVHQETLDQAVNKLGLSKNEVRRKTAS